MTTDLVPFEYGDRNIHALLIDGEPWFVAAEICTVLGIANPRDALRSLDDDEKQQVSQRVANADGLGNLPADRTVNVVNEPGLYSLILRSRKPEAKAFKRWVTHEVLPALRMRGTYTVPDRELPPAVHKSEVLQLAHYQERAARRRERELNLAARGMYLNHVTGEILPLPDSLPKSALEDTVREVVTDIQRRADRAGDSPHEPPREFRTRNKPFQSEIGKR